MGLTREEVVAFQEHVVFIPVVVQKPTEKEENLLVFPRHRDGDEPGSGSSLSRAAAGGAAAAGGGAGGARRCFYVNDVLLYVFHHSK